MQVNKQNWVNVLKKQGGRDLKGVHAQGTPEAT